VRNGNSTAVVRLLDRCAAAHHGRQAGRQGLSAEEAADTVYLVRLRRQLEAERADIRAHLLSQLDAAVQVLRVRRNQLLTDAKQAARDRRHRYEELCAIYGRSWQRAHIDKSFARIGWRCPRLSEPELEVHDD